jgi:hypothetical protein
MSVSMTLFTCLLLKGNPQAVFCYRKMLLMSRSLRKACLIWTSIWSHCYRISCNTRRKLLVLAVGPCSKFLLSSGQTLASCGMKKWTQSHLAVFNLELLNCLPLIKAGCVYPASIIPFLSLITSTMSYKLSK